MPTKKRHPKNKKLAEEIRGRLEELRIEREMNYSEFAAAAAVPRPQYNAWRNDGRVPGGFYLHRMAKRLGVTSDWLLCIDGAPKFPRQWRKDTQLEQDLAESIARHVAAELQCDIADVSVDGHGALRDTLTNVLAQCKTDAKRNGEAWPLIRDGAHVQNLLVSLGARSVPDVKDAERDHDFVVRATRAGIERVKRLSASIEASSWNGPARLKGKALANLLRGPQNRANPTEPEQRSGKFDRPERDFVLEAHREQVRDNIEQPAEDNE